MDPKFLSNCVQPLLTDLYQITMVYSYWKDGKENESTVFELYFRRNPFKGEFAIFAGLRDCLLFLQNFRFSDTDIQYLKSKLPPRTEPEFFTFLAGLTAKELKLTAVPEGSIVFPKIPLITIEGPLAISQLVETTLLNLVNYATLVTTNAARYRLAATDDVKLYEFGLRRAQGPDGGLSASKYAFLGGFDGTSNVLAAKVFDIPVTGTHAHSFVMTYDSLESLNTKVLRHAETKQEHKFLEICVKWRNKLATFLNFHPSESSEGEFAAFIAYAIAFPDSFVALIDTYNVVQSGLPNFCSVSLALDELKYRAIGIRIDSGDLAYLSKIINETFINVATHLKLPWFAELSIIASNDLNEEIIYSLREQKHKVNTFAIGTHLVTCQKQPALGGVYKLMEINGIPCIKLSEDLDKVTIPGRKRLYRLYGANDYAILDLLTKYDEPPPKKSQRILCRHPLIEAKRAYVTPNKVVRLHDTWWADGKICKKIPSLLEIKTSLRDNLKTLRNDIKRYLNPTPYKVSITQALYEEMHAIWLKKAPIGELS